MRKKIQSIAMILVAVLFLVLLDVTDAFTCGYQCDALRFDDLYPGDLQGTVDLSQQAYQLRFSPGKNHLSGLVLYFSDLPEGDEGRLKLTIENAKGKAVDTVTLRQSDLLPEYRVLLQKQLKKGAEYTLTITAEDYVQAPTMMKIDPACLTGESIDDNLMIGYSYRQSTFGSAEKIMLSILTVGILLIALGFVNSRDDGKRAGVVLLLLAMLAWNYARNVLDSQNSVNVMESRNLAFEIFQFDSEALITNAIAAEKDGVWYGGACWYDNMDGSYHDLPVSEPYQSDGDWNQGYHRRESKIRVLMSGFSYGHSQPGNYMRFASGDVFQITDTEYEGDWIVVTLDSGRPLNPRKHGDLSEAIFLNEAMEEAERGIANPYTSQYALQGRVYRQLARYVQVDTMRAMTALATAVSVMLVVCLIAKKYDRLMAGIFYCVFLLSPWVVNFARNLYWVEFTWFLPMAVGLLCAWKIDNRKIRVFSCCGAFLTIMLKCLCGYEYISTVMMGLIQFLLVDMVMAAIRGERKKAGLLLRTIFLLGLAALAGFAAAICVHAGVRAHGDYLEGIVRIFKEDVLRRTYGGDVNIFDPASEVGLSLSASVWEVLCKYFRFYTQIITGLPGNLFPLLCLAPLCIFAYDGNRKKLKPEWMLMYAVFLIAPVSWFVLAKAHSYVHTHMNFVLWYFGFVQICMYIIAARAIDLFKRSKRDL